MKLHGYFRSGAAYRVRIALNLKGLSVEHVTHHLRKGEQNAPSFLEMNPQGLVPALELDDGTILTQSVAIIEWLEETHPTPALLPGDALHRARIRAFALAIACDVHPIQNLRVINTVRDLTDDETSLAWAARVNREGLAACEKLAAGNPGPFLFGAAPTLADVLLVPQLVNARRFKVDVAAFPRLLAAETAMLSLDAVQRAAPDQQPDAE